MHFFVGQHGLGIAGQGRHPVQIQGPQIVGGQDRQNARYFQGRFGIDRLDRGVRVGAADEITEHHVRQLDVVGIVAFALDEADIFLALPRATDTAKGRFPFLVGHFCRVGHSAASLCPLNRLAASWMALTIF